jgi:tetratricopeptide (TPR) repeat protein
VAVTWRAWDLALEDVGAAIEADPLLREAWELRGFLLARDLPEKRDETLGRPLALRDPAKAEPDFLRAQELAGDQEKGLLALTARYGRAIARMAQAGANPAKLKEADEDVRAALATIPQELDKWVGARKPETPQDRICTARRLFELDIKIAEKLGDKDRAAKSKERLDALVAQCQLESERMIDEGCALRDRRSYSDAIARFDRAVDLDPDYAGNREKPGHPAEPAIAYYHRGTCYLKIGNFVPGILDFSHALEINPRWADQFYNKVYQVSYVVDLNRVITELNRVVADHPDISFVVFLRGFFYVAKTEFKQFEKSDLDFGIKDFEKTLELNPKHATAWIYRGFLFYKKTQPQGGGKPAIADKDKPDDRKAAFDEALRDYDKAIENDSRSGIARFLKSMCWSTMSMEDGLTPEEKQSRKEKAVDELEAAMERDFKGYDRIKAEKCFEAIRDNPRFVKLMGNK